MLSTVSAADVSETAGDMDVSGGLEHEVQVQGEYSEVYSVDITWGSMKLDLKMTRWNYTKHIYEDHEFIPAEENSNIITVVNHSNAIVAVQPVLEVKNRKFPPYYFFDEFHNADEQGRPTKEYCIIDAGKAGEADNAGYAKIRIGIRNTVEDTYPYVYNHQYVNEITSEYMTVGNIALQIFTGDYTQAED